MPKLPTTIGRNLPSVTGGVETLNGGQISSGINALGASNQRLAQATQNLGQQLTNTGNDRFEAKAKADKEAEAKAAKAAKEAKTNTDKFERARAKSHMRRSIMAAQDGFEDRQDYDKFEQDYEDNVGKAYADAGALISDDSVRQLFDIEANDMFDTGLIKVRGKVRKKEQDFGLATTEDVLQQNENAYLTAASRGDEKTANTILKDSAEMINAAAGKGYYSQTQARKKRHDHVTKLMTDRLDMMPSADRIKALKPDDETTPRQFFSPLLEGSGIPLTYAVKVASIESRFDPSAVNPQSSAAGLFQFTKGTAKHYSLDDPLDPTQSTQAFVRMTKTNAGILKKTLGRDATEAELYLAHQQGPTGALALLSNPDELAVDVLTPVYKNNRKMAEQAVANNGGTVDMTAQEFADKWISKYEKEPAINHGKVAVYGSTGTWTDLLSSKQKQDAYRDAVLNIDKQTKDEKAGRLADMTVKESGLFNAAVDGTLEFKTISDYEEAHRGEPNAAEYSEFLRKMLNPLEQNKMEQTTEIEKLEGFDQLSQKLVSLRLQFGGTVEDSGEVKLNAENIAAYREFRTSVMQEVNKTITPGEAKTLTGGMDDAILEAVNSNRSGSSDGYRIKPGIQDPHGHALDNIDTYLENKGMKHNIALKKKLFMEFSNSLGRFDDKGKYVADGKYQSTGSKAGDQKVIRKALSMAIENINKDNFTGVFDTEKMPNHAVRIKPSAPKIGTVSGGYKYKGGNPSDKGNWEKVE